MEGADMKRLGMAIGVVTTVVMLCSPATSPAAPRARFRAETVLNDPSVRISVGFDHTCQINEDGTVRCWGGNAFGQLGNGGTTPSSRPVLVSGLNNAVAIAAGRFYTCAVLSDGKAKCWGANNLAQLGDGTVTLNRLTPVAVTGMTRAVAIAAGEAHTCVVLLDGFAKCWGIDNLAQLGIGGIAADSASTPLNVKNVRNAVAIAAGFFHTCALIVDGRVICWGANRKGELGRGKIADSPSVGFEGLPEPVRDVGSAVAIAAGGAHTCALLADGSARCWGLDNYNQLGDNPSSGRLSDFSSTPLPVVGLSNAAGITAGNAHTCALLANGTAKCWGLNTDGQLGNGNTQTQRLPVTVGPGGNALLNVVAISTGGHRCFANQDSGDSDDFECAGDHDHTCALLADGSAKCWGSNAHGELGSEISPGSLLPVAVTGGGGGFAARDVAAGRDHTCAVRANGTVACWGSNDHGQLGDGTTTTRLSPVAVSGLSDPVVAIAAGEAHTCALVASGTVRCWGDNSSGQLGTGDMVNRLRPVTIIGIINAIGIAAGGTLGSSHTCVLLADGTVKCWGANGSGQLGTGNTLSSTVPVAVSGLRNAVSIAVGESHTCAQVAVSAAFCWGFNGSGQLGTPSTANPLLPGLVGLDNFVAIAGGNNHTCAVRADGSPWCWGNNLLGQLGIGSTVSQSVPMFAGLSNAVAIAGGFGHTCALVADGSALVGPSARCWGDNSVGQLGNSTVTSSLTPVPVGKVVGNLTTFFSPLQGAVGITTGRRHSCALQVNGGVTCWGDNGSGQLGIGSTINQFGPVVVPSFLLNIDPSVDSKRNARVVEVTIVANCEAGRLFVEVALSQGKVEGHGVGTGQCTGRLERYPVSVLAWERDGFLAGPAKASAAALIVKRGDLETQQWTRQVTLGPVP